jgi:hypothetical protein
MELTQPNTTTTAAPAAPPAPAAAPAPGPAPLAAPTSPGPAHTTGVSPRPGQSTTSPRPAQTTSPRPNTTILVQSRRVVTVGFGEMKPQTLPVALTGYMSREQWSAICTDLNRTDETAHMWACCGEITCCVLFFFPFIFLCHPCCYAALKESMIHR